VHASDKMQGPCDSGAIPKKRIAVRKTRWFAFFESSHNNQEAEATKCVGTPVGNKDTPSTIHVSSIHEADSTTPYQHQLIMIYNKHSLTKGQAESAISNHLNVKLADNCNVQPLEKVGFNRYIDQFWSPPHRSKSEPEQIIKDCIKMLEFEKRIVTHRNLKTKLGEIRGAYFVNRHKSLIEFMMKRSEYFTYKVTVTESISHDDNFSNGAKVVAAFARILNHALSTKNYNTAHSKFKNIGNNDMTLAILMIAILPIVVKRKESPDNLPALYFYGNAGTGKSYFFNLHTAYHKVATDAAGVSRYRLHANEDAFLLDDINSKTLDDRINCSTVRNLALGGTATVKTMGDIEEVRGFVVCTSNDTPNFLSEKVTEDSDTEAIYEAWRRRFLTVNFTALVDENPVYVRFDYTSATDALKCFFHLCYNLLQDPDVKEMFRQYYEAVKNTLSQDCLNKFKEAKLALPNFMDNTNFQDF
jgi:hypothetical protein